MEDNVLETCFLCSSFMSSCLVTEMSPIFLGYVVQFPVHVPSSPLEHSNPVTTITGSRWAHDSRKYHQNDTWDFVVMERKWLLKRLAVSSGWDVGWKEQAWMKATQRQVELRNAERVLRSSFGSTDLAAPESRRIHFWDFCYMNKEVRFLSVRFGLLSLASWRFLTSTVWRLSRHC